MTLSRLAALATLGVDADATGPEITRAYRRLARELHPDRCPSPDAAERFTRLREAYQRALDTTAAPPPSRGEPGMGASWTRSPGRRPPIVAGPPRVDPPQGRR